MCGGFGPLGLNKHESTVQEPPPDLLLYDQNGLAEFLVKQLQVFIIRLISFRDNPRDGSSMPHSVGEKTCVDCSKLF